MRVKTKLDENVHHQVFKLHVSILLLCYFFNLKQTTAVGDNRRSRCGSLTSP
jgi:hypothetical protein